MEEQLDLFSFIPEVQEDIKIDTTKQKYFSSIEKSTNEDTKESSTLTMSIEESVTEIIEVINVEPFNISQEEQVIMYRSDSSVKVDDIVKVERSIDSSAESEGYFSYHKGRKGRVTAVQETKKPSGEQYQFSVTVLFPNKETGIFYDLELEVVQ
ncbi:hypothetical protein [Viridibacillus arvi]|uniref:hypothetical protein n=1 Tax=Viridibacillus arvi TaxID=263475 RepID=UPI0034D01E71